MVFPLTLVYKAWLEVDGYTLSSCAQSLEEDSSETLQLFFPAFSPDLEAVSFGRKFEITSREIFTLFDAMPTDIHSTMRDRNRLPIGYEIHEQDPETSKAKASAGGFPLVLVKPDQSMTERQIAILSGGRIQVSPDVVGKSTVIHCAVFYPEVALMSSDPLGEFSLHAVGEDGSSLRHVKLPHCRLKGSKLPPRTGRGLSLAIKYSLDDIQVTPL